MRCRRPYRNEYTGSLPNSEVNRCRALSVGGWGTASEAIRVLPAFGPFCHLLLIFHYMADPDLMVHVSVSRIQTSGSWDPPESIYGSEPSSDTFRGFAVHTGIKCGASQSKKCILREEEEELEIEIDFQF